MDLTPPRAVGQTTPVRQDSTTQDTVVPRGPNHAGVAVGLAAAMLDLLVAPGLTVSLSKPDTTQLGFARNHIAVYVVGGPFTTLSRGNDSWSYSAGIEFLRNGAYVEARAENFLQNGGVQWWTVRSGYLLHPKPAVAGGAVLGYRVIGRGASENALEVGFPIAVGSLRNWARLEPIYVISSHGVSWTYGFRGEWPIGHSLFGGFDFHFTPLRQDAPYVLAFTVLFGWRR